MKKIFCMLLAVVMVAGLTACVQPTSETPSEEPSVSVSVTPNASESGTVSESTQSFSIGYSTLTIQGDYMSAWAEMLKTKFTALGHEFEVASADMNPIKQIEQIENFITKGVDEIIIMAVDPTSLTDVIKRAMDQGIKIVAFTQKTSAYDISISADEPEIGKACAEIAADWVEKTFPDAKPGSIEIAVFENRDKPSAAERSDALQQITTLTDKVTIGATVGVELTAEGAQTAMENLMITNPDVKLVLCYNCDVATGVDTFSMALNSAIKDRAHFAAFSTDFNTVAAASITKSVNNESIWRGTVMMSERSMDKNADNVINAALDALKGTVKTKDLHPVITKITPENVNE